MNNKIFFDYINTLPTPKERQYYIILNLTRNKGPYYVLIKSHKNKIKNITLKDEIKPKFTHRKYEIFVSLIDYIKSNHGRVDDKVLFHLRSDCESKKDIDEFFYHLYKNPLAISDIIDILSRYHLIYKDNFFQDTLQFYQGSLGVTHNKTLTGNEVRYVIGCDQRKLLFTTINNLSSSDFQFFNIINSTLYKSILLKLRTYVTNNFIVNCDNKHNNKGKFILDPNKEEEVIKVEVYNNQIISIYNNE
ncbi:KM727_gp32-like protein [Aratus pisonii nudivirus]|nr:KM727_gp32-like protein [Aratus pisonii nudivirus]